MMINMVIINAHKQDRDRITAVVSVQKEIKIMAHGRDGYDALKLVGSLKPDIAILDNHLEYISGEEISPLIRARSSSTAVVIIAGKISDYQLYRAAANEVSGIIYKEKDMDELPRILKSVSEGGCFINPIFAARLLRFFNGMGRKGADTAAPVRRIPGGGVLAKFPPGQDPTEYLSKTELRVLTNIGEGYSSTQIAENLDLAVGTVRNYISSVMRKTGLQSRSQMARFAFSYGLVPLWPQMPHAHTRKRGAG